MAFNKAYSNRINTFASRILDFLKNPNGFYREGLVLVSDKGIIYGITIKEGTYSTVEMDLTRAVLDQLITKGQPVVYVDEQIRFDVKYVKFSALNRKISSGWEQVKTKLVAMDADKTDLENVRNSYLEWKANNRS